MSLKNSIKQNSNIQRTGIHLCCIYLPIVKGKKMKKIGKIYSTLHHKWVSVFECEKCGCRQTQKLNYCLACARNKKMLDKIKIRIKEIKKAFHGEVKK